eukprot:4187928-Prymnesium_polylepis.1
MALIDALADAGLVEHVPLVEGCEIELVTAAADKKRLLELLKECGLQKMGIRMKAAAVVMDFAASTAAPSAPPPAA